MKKGYLIVMLVILAAYGITFFNQRSVGRAVADATVFEDIIEEQGGEVVPFQEVIQPEAKLEEPEAHFAFSIAELFYREPTTFNLPEAQDFVAAVKKMTSQEGIELPASSNIAGLFAQARPTVLTTKDGAAFLRALKSNTR